MPGFVQYLQNPTMILRVWNEEGSQKKYNRSVTGELHGRVVHLQGYDQGIEPHFFTEAMSLLFHSGFLAAVFERVGPPHRTLFCSLGPEGVVSMKSKLHRATDAKHPDGSLNKEAIAAGVEDAKAKYASGEEVLLDFFDITLHDGSVMTVFHHIAAEHHGK